MIRSQILSLHLRKQHEAIKKEQEIGCDSLSNLIFASAKTTLVGGDGCGIIVVIRSQILSLHLRKQLDSEHTAVCRSCDSLSNLIFASAKTTQSL